MTHRLVHKNTHARNKYANHRCLEHQQKKSDVNGYGFGAVANGVHADGGEAIGFSLNNTHAVYENPVPEYSAPSHLQKYGAHQQDVS